ncbi:hypothetical protein M427DRAFT_158206 [Gonapodya prolifera JEL478]|uniref:Transmembrane protein 223 n=1 Tax=Gonapodya prolifera (strain JEL478) TaxID=1344416 RepID=A0A139A3S3_GONPJ|nr:hypothetical protein M427DRAFT_158206 [Gonapodya prolifera JEL478]|eukprot:KXS11467.1 hypothetical protein M427DRAFT_158206 [Gonapodya prolifera JEL478]
MANRAYRKPLSLPSLSSLTYPHVLYTAPPGNTKIYYLAYAGGVSIFTWLASTASLTLVALTEEEPVVVVKADGGKPAVMEKRTVLAPEWKRQLYAGMFFVLGLGMPLIAHGFARRSVRKLTLLDGGKRAEIENYSLLGRKTALSPIVDMGTRERVTSIAGAIVPPTGKAFLHLEAKGSRMFKAYLLDRKGDFYDGRTFDFLFNKDFAK